MSQWKSDDSAANSVLWGVSGYKKRANTVNQANFYDNVSRGAFITNEIVGQFGVDNNEIGVALGNVVHVTAVTNGTGYMGNANTTISGGGGQGANVTAIAASGKITSYTLVTAGNTYSSSPTITVDAPYAAPFNANSAVTAGPSTGLSTDANSSISLASAASYAAGDAIIYRVAAGNTALTGLTSGSTYYIQAANTSWVSLTSAVGGTRITLTKGLTETGHTLQGVTATAGAAINGGKNVGIAHAGWNVRKVGTGGRAGRVQYETLVAMGSMTSDGSDDTILPDA